MFLILARKAQPIQKHQSLGSWRYKVANRIALRARGDISRRRTQEKEAVQTAPSTTPGEAVQRQLGQMVDEEVQRLPEKYWAPVTPCYLQGRTNKEVRSASPAERLPDVQAPRQARGNSAASSSGPPLTHSARRIVAPCAGAAISSKPRSRSASASRAAASA